MNLQIDSGSCGFLSIDTGETKYTIKIKDVQFVTLSKDPATLNSIVTLKFYNHNKLEIPAPKGYDYIATEVYSNISNLIRTLLTEEEERQYLVDKKQGLVEEDSSSDFIR